MSAEPGSEGLSAFELAAGQLVEGAQSSSSGRDFRESLPEIFRTSGPFVRALHQLVNHVPTFCARRLASTGAELLPRHTRLHMKTHSLALLVMFSTLSILACGYSEEEWQAQLARYGDLEAEHANEKKAHAATSDELNQTQERVRDLLAELERMGVDVEQLNQRLQEEGTEKERLAADLTEMQRALDEYKKRAAQLERIKQRFELLRKKLEKLTNLGLKVQIRHNRMVISLPGDVLFASGQDTLRDEGVTVLGAVAEVIRTDKQLNARYFQVAGHTDNKPLRYSTKFVDNWGLSAMRARQVLVYLIAPIDSKDGGGGLNARRLHVAGYGETDPVADNATEEGRQANRRVELVLMPDVEEMLDLKSLL